MNAPLVNTPDLWLKQFPRPQPDGHKYHRGHVGVLTGNLSHTGAARLAARAALRSGAGLVTLLSPPDALIVNAANSLAVMVQSIDGPDALTTFILERKLNALVLGPGGGVGKRMQQMVLAALASPASCVFDADALTSFSETPDALFAAIKARRVPVVLTPHEGEVAKLFPDLGAKSPKKDRACAAAERSGAWVVLKGADTIVAAPSGQASEANNAPPDLATAGTGDVLAGLIGGLLAQGMEPFLAASAAVWLHAEAANFFGPGLIAEDLPGTLPQVYRHLFHNDLKDLA